MSKAPPSSIREGPSSLTLGGRLRTSTVTFVSPVSPCGSVATTRSTEVPMSFSVVVRWNFVPVLPPTLGPSGPERTCQATVGVPPLGSVTTASRESSCRASRDVTPVTVTTGGGLGTVKLWVRVRRSPSSSSTWSWTCQVVTSLALVKWIVGLGVSAPTSGEPPAGETTLQRCFSAPPSGSLPADERVMVPFHTGSGAWVIEALLGGALVTWMIKVKGSAQGTNGVLETTLEAGCLERLETESGVDPLAVAGDCPDPEVAEGRELEVERQPLFARHVWMGAQETADNEPNRAWPLHLSWVAGERRDRRGRILRSEVGHLAIE